MKGVRISVEKRRSMRRRQVNKGRGSWSKRRSSKVRLGDIGGGKILIETGGSLRRLKKERSGGLTQKRGRWNNRRGRRHQGEVDRCRAERRRVRAAAGCRVLVLHVFSPTHWKAGHSHGLVDHGGALTCLIGRGAVGVSLGQSHRELGGTGWNSVTMIKKAFSWIMDLKTETKQTIRIWTFTTEQQQIYQTDFL